MAMPPFVSELRSMVGHHPLWMAGISAVVQDDTGRLLFNRRADNGRWALIGGILDPGEQPAQGAVRECYEETGVHIAVERLTSVTVSKPVVHDNGDHAQYLELTFLCRAVGGEARVNDDESLEVAWFAPDALPAIAPRQLMRLRHALSGQPEAYFVGGDPALDALEYENLRR